MSRMPSGELLAVGIDIVEIGKVGNLLAHRLRFLKRIFCPEELLPIAEGRPLRRGVVLKRLACSFAAKEALFKAVGKGWGQGMRWNEVCVTREGSGSWRVTLGGNALKTFRGLGGGLIQMDICSFGDSVLAYAAIYGEERQNPRS